MTRPLILVLYEKILPGSQLLNRLQDLGYEVQTLAEPELLVSQAEVAKPLLIIADCEPRQTQVCGAISGLKNNASTNHIPVIGLASARNTALHEAARAAGAKLVVHDNAILVHLKHFLDQALQVD